MTRLPAFAANGMPLSPGLRLLEASAGTGKTFALAHLVLRLLSEGPGPLAIEQLLVVTFTDAAAAELRARIAHRLQEALTHLECAAAGREPPRPADSTLVEWLEARGADGDGSLRGRLLLALEQLDRADITTIHGFCRRTLQRHALEAGLGPAVVLETAAAERRAQIVHDYWQQQVLPLPSGDLAGLLERQVDPDRLAGLLLKLDSDPALELDPLPPPLRADRPLHPQLQDRRRAAWDRFRRHWDEQSQQLEQDLATTATEAKQAGIPYSPYRLKPKADKLERVQAWLEGHEGVPAYEAVLAVKELRDYFHPGSVQRLESAVHGADARLPRAELLEAIAELVDGPAELLLLHFGHWGRAELARRRERSGEMGFGQLLEQLDPGEEAAGAAAPPPLLQAVAARYRAALIDEFQDTDPIQWRILQSAFAGPPARHLLVMVGDPKQAIYRFRGGELATYRLAAGRADERYGLTCNRRSSRALVEGLNALMQPGLQRSDLEVPQVEWCPRDEQLVLPPGEPPLQLLPLDPHQLEERVAAYCQALLERGLELRRGERGQRLSPGDLCLLVNRHAEAEALRVALERRGLPSRLVSQGDVFASEGALALQRLLDALARPGDPGRLRLLAASSLLGWSAARIRSCPAGDWDALADELSRLADLVPRQGVMAVLGQLLGSDCLARLALRGRALADLQQAAELLQEQMHRQALSIPAAADWLRNVRLQEDRDVPEPHLCRSDADAEAIAVVTVHRSKGLEFTAVVCPYLWKARGPARAGGGSAGRRWRPPGSARPRFDLHLNPHWGVGRAAAAEEVEADLQEAERRAYVACTRARHLLVLGWPGEEQTEAGNPLSPWLWGIDTTGGPASGNPAAGGRPLPLAVIDPTSLPPPERRWRPDPPAGELALGRVPQRSLDSRWGRASYSAWTHAGTALPPEALEEGRDRDALSRDGESDTGTGGSGAAASSASPDAAGAGPTAAAPATASSEAASSEATSSEATTVWPPLGPLARFPRGAAPGDALHRMLEQIDYPALAAGELEPARLVVTRELERSGLDVELAGSVLEGLRQLVLTPLGGGLGAFRLADLPAGGWLNELAFDLPLAVTGKRLVRSSGLAEAFRDHPGGRFGAAYAEQLGRLTVASRGFLTGSIDLVFRSGERWWVADWKSNWLGRRDERGEPLRCGPDDYSEEAMEGLMATNHYPLQAHLYLVALHRYLRWRLPGYRPEQHLGGYAYVFLRGVPGPMAHEALHPAMVVPGVLVEPAPLERVQALDRLLREGQP